MKELKKQVFSFIPLLIISSNVYASGWTQKSGHGLLINNFSYYSTSHYFDANGDRKPLNGNYTKYEMNPYIEYGISDNTTIGANIFLSRVFQKNTIASSNATNYGLGDSELFIRHRIWQGNGFSFAVEPLIKLPSLQKYTIEPKVGSTTFDAGLTTSSGYSFKAFEKHHFANIDISYRHSFGPLSDRVKIDTSVGFSVSEDLILLPQLFITSRLSSAISPSNNTSADNYSLRKLQLSAIYKLTPDFSLQAGVFSNISGRNTGGGNGGLFAVHKVF